MVLVPVFGLVVSVVTRRGESISASPVARERTQRAGRHSTRRRRRRRQQHATESNCKNGTCRVWVARGGGAGRWTVVVIGGRGRPVVRTVGWATLATSSAAETGRNEATLATLVVGRRPLGAGWLLRLPAAGRPNAARRCAHGRRRLGSIWLGSAHFGSAHFSSVPFGSARLHLTRLSSLNSVGFGSVRLILARLGFIWLGSVQLGSARFSLARLESAAASHG